MSSWQVYERAQKEVYRKLRARERPQAVVGAGWGFLDHFFIFLFSLGFFARVDFRPARVKRVMVPTLLMILTYEVKQLVGISSMNQLEEHLFRDTALLKIIGFTARQIQEGFCQRGQGKRRGPMHRDTLADFLSRFTARWILFWRKRCGFWSSTDWFGARPIFWMPRICRRRSVIKVVG